MQPKLSYAFLYLIKHNSLDTKSHLYLDKQSKETKFSKLENKDFRTGLQVRSIKGQAETKQNIHLAWLEQWVD